MPENTRRYTGHALLAVPLAPRNHLAKRSAHFLLGL